MPSIPIFEGHVLQELCNTIADTASGLTGGEIGQLLRSCGIDDVSESTTKRVRLFDALQARQQRDRCGNNVAAFIRTAMAPVRYVNNPDLFETRRCSLNRALAFCGLMICEDGELKAVTAAKTISEAEQRMTKLRRDLLNRQVHSDVLAFCRTELLQDNYFHAVFEATKSVADKIRQKSGLLFDGTTLVIEAFGSKNGSTPLLAFNSLRTKSEQNEQEGLMNLMKGLFGAFRNVTAHEPKIRWTIPEQDALDMLSLASFLHRKLDNAVRTR